MRKLILVPLLAAALTAIAASPAGARENPARKAARLACLQERASIGNKAFRAKYGHEAMQVCIAQHGGGSPPPPKPHPKHHGEGDQGNQGDNGKHHGHGGNGD